ncbi:MAG: hypothetical protein O9346_10935 [Leptospiraceae bacterium]|nr:hypothetical protein [Leptospiraceae bacterium]
MALKRKSNPIKKHKISFADASRVFLDKNEEASYLERLGKV